MSTPSPIFIVGFGRSGTKLIRSILCNSPGVSIPDIETNFLPYWSGRFSSFGELSKRENFSRFFEFAKKAPFFYYASRRGRTVGEDEWFAKSAPYDLPAVFEALLKIYVGFDDERDLVWGDKSPTYISHLGLLHRLYPDARFVHIVRDCRDCCLSAHKAWGTSISRCAQRWNDSVQLPSEDMRGCAEMLYELRYEDLLANADKTVRELFEFLEIRFHPDVLERVDSGEGLGAGRKSTVILTDNSRKYEKSLNEKMKLRIDKIAGSGLVKFGYPTGYERSVLRLSRNQMNVLRLHDGVIHLARRARESGFVSAARFVSGFLRQNLASERISGRD